MSERPSGSIDRTVDSLSEVPLSDESLDSLLGHIGRLGVRVLDGCDAAATSIVEHDRVASFGITDERINRVDQSQYDNDAGPCVDAIKKGEIQYFDGTDIHPTWRDFAEDAEGAEVRSVMSFPIELDGSTLGAINFYSSRRDAFRQGQREEGLVFASHAAISLVNLKEFNAARRQAEQLEEALQTRTMIGQATGLLMAQDGLTSAEAFQKLVHVSQNSNIKLREIASRYVEAWEADRAP